MPNPSFEDTVACPTNISQLYNCQSWFPPTLGTSDYFNQCNSNPFSVGVPANQVGYQFAKTGNGYSGIAAYYEFSPDVEFISCKLIQPLKSGRKYAIEFSVSLADSSKFAISAIGACLSVTPDTNYFTSFNQLPIGSQIVSPPNYIITETQNWYKISGEFLALGGEEYLTIGNFKDWSSVQFQVVYNSTTSPASVLAYYYVDDVSITEVDSFFVPNIFSPNYDGINDVFKITGLNDGDIVEIYNRWGTKVYDFAGKNDAWDGRTTSGVPCENGIYYYILFSKENFIDKGFIQLLR